MTLYLKYRPQTLDELDQTRVREQLKRIVSSGNIPHALLFSGPKGTGKTSAARILAKIVNCELTAKGQKLKANIEPCNKCDQCVSITKGSNLDVIELDAASHRGIDEARSLRESVKLAPAKAKKKVYIIDESHMLTTEASNALLKTLEEPPDHVIFILATTNPEKLIETVRSRLTNIKFEKATKDEIKRQLIRVMKGEQIKAEKGVVMAIAKASEGSFRDSVKILEQLTIETKDLKKTFVDEFLFKNTLKLEDLFQELAKKNLTKALLEIEKIVKSGGSIKGYIDALIERVRTALLSKVGIGDEDLENFNKEELLELTEFLQKARGELSITPIPQLPLEVAIIKWCDKEIKNEKQKKEKDIEENATNSRGINDETWKKILAEVKPKNTSLEALLRATRPINFDGKNLTLGVYYKFHKERIETFNFRKVLEDVVTAIVGAPISVICTLIEPPLREQKKENREVSLTEPEDEDIISAAKEIFGNV